MTPFLIGIDLGTTNSACAFVDTRVRHPRVRTFEIPQLVAPFALEARPVLPSFLYFGEPREIESGALGVPWNPHPDAAAGVFARDRGAEAPTRQVASAKSWLAHPSIDRRAAILPRGAEGGPRISPVDASGRYLAHLRDAWNATVAAADEHLRFERQTIVLTVPASFDEEARELTVEAARAAGFSRLTLLEEPIAAFYAWLSEHHRPGLLDDGHIALVCDVGGGTTDFSLIRVRVEAGVPSFERFAIGEHLLLGGDNMDVALATLLEPRLLEHRPAARLAITERSALRRMCAAAKERMLGDDPPNEVGITVLGAGRAVIGGSMSTVLTRDDVERTLADFLPMTAPGELASPRDRRAGLRELGLPYETDPAITRHLAAFLHRSSPALAAEDPSVRSVGGRGMVRPDLVLFNGGFFTPPLARRRVADALAAWFGEEPRVLEAGNFEAAVAIGAATYARLRAGVGVPLALVRAGSGRAYYVGLRGAEAGAATPAVCVLPLGTEEGTTCDITHLFTVATNRPIAFALYSSTVRSDRAGDIVDVRHGEDVHEHAPLVTVLRYGRRSRQVELPVRLSVSFTEVGTLELWCASQVSEHRWRLQFQLRGDGREDVPVERGAAQTEASPAAEADAIVPEEAVTAGEHAIRAVFEGRGGELTSESLAARLEQIVGYGKTAWPLPVIRRFADVLLAAAEGRRRSPPLEARWLNLFGFCLRPGFGAAKDAWRIGEARKVYAAGLAFPNAVQNRAEWLVLWQRAAGGFSAGQQRELALRVMGELALGGKRGPRLHPQLERESWRLLASLERLDARVRVNVGDELVRRLRRDPGNVSLLWAIGRLGARVPMYGPLSSVVPPTDAARWLDDLMAFDGRTPELCAAIVQIGAMTADPLRDVDAAILARARDRVGGEDAVDARPLFEVVERTAADVNRVFGEPLPAALQLAGR